MHAILHALSIAGSMTWEITWALILGFALSALVQAVVRKSTIGRLLGDDRPRTLALAAGLGAASSSCSYAAVALARSLFRKGANFTAAMAFEIASTNLVVELGVILALLMGWQFTVAEFAGGLIMITVLAVLFRIFLRERLLREARQQAERGTAGAMEGHAAMDMSVRRHGSFARRLFSRDGHTSVAHVFVMEWAAILRDLVLGLLIAGAIAAWVPDSFWRAFFFEGHPLATKLWGPLVGPLVAIASFVCSIGNVPLAATVIAGYIVEFAFGGLGLVPDQADAKVPMEGVSWNYTTWLNIAFLLLAATLAVRFLRTGGIAMLRMMGGAPEGDHAGEGKHGGHDTGPHRR
ncbi:permease [Streptomyces rhizosphaericus]|uniref:Permease n=1 Tax=Streptomyces rhizosphaericus TaxID=114699 RepID=A0A6G4A7F7_9ACTN|nr:permease [Streptomyces rhizosphaericus]NEW69128.1 permease [Streptomyces rhizosphaericus]